MFLSLLNYLNKTHNINKNENYWRIIIYPWVCFYVSTIFDRWEIINYLLKNEKKKLFYTYEYNTDKKFDEISNTLDWFYKSQSDEFNDKIFNEIIKFKNTGKIKIIKKKIKSLKKNKKNDKKKKLNLFEIIDTLLSKIGIFSNTIFLIRLILIN